MNPKGVDIVTLQRELLARLDAHPMDEWPCGLLHAVTALIDVQYGDPTELLRDSTKKGRARLRLV